MKGIFIERDVKRQKSGMLKSHFHAFYEIYYLAKGRMRYIISDKLFDVRSGDVVLIPANVLHNTSYDDEVTERLLINFDSSFISKNELLSLFSKGVIHLSDSSRFDFEGLYKKIGDEIGRSDDYSKDLISQYLTEMLIIFLRNDSASAPKKLDGYSLIMQDAVDYINQSYGSDLSLDTAAKRASLSKSFFSKKFKEVTGFGFSEYLTLVRIKNAERMLSEGKLSVTEIAFECGFNDSSYFAATFKKLIGSTPKKYEKANKT